MKRKFNKLFLSSMVLTIFLPTLVSCSKGTESSKPKPVQPGEYRENTAFTNKLEPTKLDSPVLELANSNSSISYSVPLSPVLKVWAGSKINQNSLPSQVKIIDQDNKATFAKVTWSLANETVVYSDMKVAGEVTYSGKTIPVNAVILQQRKDLANENNFVLREEGLSVDQEKSTKDGANTEAEAKANLLKLIDRSGQYGASGSRWDNWKTFGQEQDNTLVFHWDNPTKLSRVEISYWIRANRDGSTEKMPKNVYIWHSKDGENWTRVLNQDKISDTDLGPMQVNNANGWSNAALPKSINFEEVETQWLKITWDPSKNANGQNYILGITNIYFKGNRTQDSLIYNKSTSIYKLEYGDQVIDNLAKDTTIEVDNFNSELKVFSNTASYDINLIQENSQEKKYVIVAYNDLGQYSTYNLTLKVKGA